MMGPKKNRKKDFETIAKIIDYNEYHAVDVECQFDKNFWFYTVKINTRNKKDNPRETTSLHCSQLKRLYEAGFIIQELLFNVSENTGIVGTLYGVSDSVKYNNLIFGITLILVREDEIKKYFRRGSFY